MKRVAHILLTVLMLTLMATGLTMCADSDGDGPADQLLDQIVTYTGNYAGQACFEYRAVDDSPLIRLTIKGQLDPEKVKPGTRLLMRYRLPAGISPNESAEVELVGLGRILSDTVRATAQPYTSPLYLLTLQRSGEYLNVQSQMPTAQKRYLFVTYKDEAGADGLMDLYVNTAFSEDAPESYDANTWASVWMGPVWQRSDIRGVRVHVDNTNNPYRKEFIFKK